MLALSLHFTTAGLVALDETLVLDAQVLDFVVSLLELDLDLVALLFSRLQLADQDVLVHLDLLFTLLHGHFKLILSILKTVDFVSASVDFLAETLDLELHDVVLHERLLLLLDDSLEVAASHLVLELELANDAIKGCFLGFDLGNDAVNVPALVLQLLVRSREELQVFLGFVQVLSQRLNLLRQLVLLLFRADTAHTVDLALHLLDLEVLRVDQLLLPLLLDLELADVGLQVARGRESSRNVTDQVRLLGSKTEQSLGLLEQDVLFVPDLFFNLAHHALRLFEFVFGAFVRRFKFLLSRLLRREPLLRCLVLFLRGLESLHLFFEDLVDVGNGTALVLQLCRERGQLVGEDGDLTFRDFHFFIAALKRLPDFDQLALFCLNRALCLFVGLLLALETTEVLLVLVLLALEPALAVTVLDTSFVDELITTATVLNSVLPLEVKLVPFLVQPFEFLGRLVELDLRGLSLRHLLLELLGLAGDLDRKLLDLESQLLNLGFIGTAELFKREVIFLFLAGSECPLLQLLLVPIHLKLELVHPLVGFEDHVLDVVQSVLLVRDALLQLLDLVPQAPALAFRDLLQMLFSFNLLVLGVDEALRMDELHLDGLKMLFKDLEALLMLLYLETQLCHEAHLLPHDLVQLFVLIVGIGWEVLVEVVLGDRVNNVVSHFSFSLALRFD